ncbi:exodeoxyribonuclease VII small subunit [Thermosediminibacter litoriperuensis]|uniref:Exodeoxyribonuclease 7 small subunit n=1 Tax=Thermosediminibacter litoriperuensis TaxID=291989 RepID=A0A5S5AKE7_9FIRM|nr:exodeoxyribonuclease VII small subunit [Thermosediminibacter litoriperuensis]TYP51641.1 exodeoxyribonuclease VII small subunit [Thermosediminibacter litoriperuensis]
MTEYKYEDAIARLEDIIEKLEKGNLSLEESLNLFEEGIRLTKICTKILDEAEGRVQVLIKDLNGEIDFKDFNGGCI